MEAAKVLWSLTVLAAVDFFRGACDFFAVDFFWLAEEVEVEEAFFLVVGDALLVDEPDDDVAVCAGNPLPCSNKSVARPKAVRRLRNIGDSV